MDKQKVTLIGSFVVVVGVVGYILHAALPVFFPTAFGGSGPPPQPPTQSTAPVGVASGDVVPSHPITSGDGAAPERHVGEAEAAKVQLEELKSELTPEAIKENPVTAARRFGKIASGYASTPAGKEAQAKLDEIRKQYGPALDAAEAKAKDEIAKTFADNKARLERLEHKLVVADLRALEDRFAGLPSAATVEKERQRVQAEWDAFPQAEKDARAKFVTIPTKFSDDESRLDGAVLADDVAKKCENTKCGNQAALRRDAILEELAASLEKQNNKAALNVAKKLPKELADTPAGKRIVALRDRLSNQ